jgi:glycosyltransferase involved in cell wall biosynthesis
MFDLHSTLKRKNPQGVLRVFEKFASARTDSCLVLKVNRWQQMGSDALNWIPQHPRIKIIKDTLSPGQLTDLYIAANCYLSLHRSEGFGRTLVEALQHGLHVVSTNFSGPKDFLDADNTLLVNWTKSNVGPNDYPNLTVKSWWAEPDEEHALIQLQSAYERAQLGSNRAGIATGERFSYSALAQRYRPVLNSYIR